ncbi:MAG TPA: serine hydrolase domain-containing protein [Ktedonobacteraceae bacterium]|nr:serine hydrolase domain-containing protein [Ktedonobacteraceae bacterium]
MLSTMPELPEWEKPVKEYIPFFKLFDPVATERMTLRDLLIHNSGLPRYDALWHNALLTRKEVVERLQYLEPTREFRTTWQYSNRHRGPLARSEST